MRPVKGEVMDCVVTSVNKASQSDSVLDPDELCLDLPSRREIADVQQLHHEFSWSVELQHLAVSYSMQ